MSRSWYPASLFRCRKRDFLHVTVCRFVHHYDCIKNKSQTKITIFEQNKKKKTFVLRCGKNQNRLHDLSKANEEYELFQTAGITSYRSNKIEQNRSEPVPAPVWIIANIFDIVN